MTDSIQKLPALPLKIRKALVALSSRSSQCKMAGVLLTSTQEDLRRVYPEKEDFDRMQAVLSLVLLEAQKIRIGHKDRTNAILASHFDPLGISPNTVIELEHPVFASSEDLLSEVQTGVVTTRVMMTGWHLERAGGVSNIVLNLRGRVQRNGAGDYVDEVRLRLVQGSAFRVLRGEHQSGAVPAAAAA